MANEFEDYNELFAGAADFVDARIVVLGVGGGGNNAIDRMVEDSNLDDVTFVAVNTDVNVLTQCKAPVKIQIGKKETKGLGAGARPEVGAKSAQENLDEISRVLDNCDVVFITAGMGGGTGTGAAPIIAKCAKEKGILTIAVVSKPFNFEGPRKMRVAEAGIQELKANVDSMLIVPNQNIFKVFKDKVTMKESFKKADEILTQSVRGIYDIIKKCGDINIDFADIKTTMTNRGIIHMGVGYGKGEDRFKQALARATQNQLLETTIDGAKVVLVQYFGDKLDMMEISRCGDEICEKADPNVDIIFGTREPEEDSDELRDFVYITIIAADFSAKEQPAETTFTGALNTEPFGVKPSQNAFQANFGQALNTPPQQPQQPIQPQQQPKPQDNGNGDDDIPSFLRARK
ncbi:MAG: cell division protein FtsZ [Clostridia bacterium]|jgi:cell division protein FtsZ|nr:cell division protein FtsZ [Clostridia bacterium]MBO7397527.1 cell division protein FtsZ [Clostridia bacterium]MBO7504551.1 cell division protein FtsZ [Clostridia bacterium]MBO7657719.1 cell division protein FtsZ [Clostridia bacterium]MBP5666249.1 cell division protein FtsZ [Clostridia bacterium]